jgi:hypothetical protein
MWNLISVYLETVFVSVQDSWTVCAKHTIHSKINLHAPDGLLDDEAQVEAHFVPFGDGANLAAR